MSRDNLRPDFGRVVGDLQRRVAELERRQLPLGKKTVVPVDAPTAGGDSTGSSGFAFNAASHVALSWTFLVPDIVLNATPPYRALVVVQGTLRNGLGGAGAWSGSLEMRIDGGGDDLQHVAWSLATSAVGDEVPFSVLGAKNVTASTLTVEVLGTGTSGSSGNTDLDNVNVHVILVPITLALGCG